MFEKLKVNVAPGSTEGHFIEKIEKEDQVINLDVVNETFYVDGSSELTTKNHTTLKNEESCLITCQVVYNPFDKVMIKSKD